MFFFFFFLPPRDIRDSELVRLAKEVDPSLYYDIGAELQIPYCELKHTLTFNNRDCSQALLDVLHKFTAKHGKSVRETLAKVLRDVNLESCRTKLLQGNYQTYCSNYIFTVSDTKQACILNQYDNMKL